MSIFDYLFSSKKQKGPDWEKEDLGEELRKHGVAHDLVAWIANSAPAKGFTRHQFQKYSFDDFRSRLGLVCDCEYFFDRLFQIADLDNDETMTKIEYFKIIFSLWKGDEDFFLNLSWQVYADTSKHLTAERLEVILRAFYRSGLRALMSENTELGDVFDVDEQMHELFVIADEYIRIFTRTTLRRMKNLPPLPSSPVSASSVLRSSTELELVSIEEFKAWAQTKPTLEIYFNGSSKTLNLTVFASST